MHRLTVHLSSTSTQRNAERFQGHGATTCRCITACLFYKKKEKQGPTPQASPVTQDHTCDSVQVNGFDGVRCGLTVTFHRAALSVCTRPATCMPAFSRHSWLSSPRALVAEVSL